ncbi:MAG: hypothetical protein ACOCTM_04220 [Bacteroidota bacterium]
MSKKPIHFLEVIWILLAVLCFILGIKAAFENQANNSLMFFLFTAIAAAMYAFRRHLRKQNVSD